MADMPPPRERPGYDPYPPDPRQQAYPAGGQGRGGPVSGGQRFGAEADPGEARTMTWDRPGGQQSQQAAWEQPPGQIPSGGTTPRTPPGMPDGPASVSDMQQAAWEHPAGQHAGWAGPPGDAAYQAPRPQAAAHGKGFVASLFDFGFTSFVTPKVVKGLYALAAAWTIFVAIFFLLVGIHLGGSGFVNIVFDLIGVSIFGLLSLGSIRVFLELFMALHRINENIQALRDREDGN
jgi:hypothetical protein